MDGARRHAGPERAADARFEFVLTHAVAINDRGLIVAIGVDEATGAEQGTIMTTMSFRFGSSA